MPRRDLDSNNGGSFEPFDGFEDEEPTPVIAAGTQNDLEAEAKAARARAGTLPDDDVAALAHDLKNPLTIIMLETAQIEQRLDPTPMPVQRGLERIAQNAAYIDRLVSDLLDMASHDAGKLELRIDTIDLARVLRDAVGRAVPTAERHRVRLLLRAFPHIEGDEMRIERVVSNLISNALKYCDGEITVQLEARASYACVSVIDSGPGLTADESRTSSIATAEGPRPPRATAWASTRAVGSSRHIVAASASRASRAAARASSSSCPSVRTAAESPRAP